MVELLALISTQLNQILEVNLKKKSVSMLSQHKSQMVLFHFKVLETFQWAIFAFQSSQKYFLFQLNNKSLQMAHC